MHEKAWANDEFFVMQIILLVQHRLLHPTLNSLGRYQLNNDHLIECSGSRWLRRRNKIHKQQKNGNMSLLMLMFIGNQQIYTKCKLSAFRMEKKNAMISWIKAVRMMVQTLTAKARTQI